MFKFFRKIFSFNRTTDYLKLTCSYQLRVLIRTYRAVKYEIFHLGHGINWGLLLIIRAIQNLDRMPDRQRLTECFEMGLNLGHAADIAGHHHLGAGC